MSKLLEAVNAIDVYLTHMQPVIGQCLPIRQHLATIRAEACAMTEELRLKSAGHMEPEGFVRNGPGHDVNTCPRCGRRSADGWNGPCR